MRLSYAYEQMLFDPKWYHTLTILLLLPLAMIYGTFMWIRRKMAVRKDFGIPIISVGNLVVGGSGKTPFTIAIAKELKDVVIISRGYGRKSKGLIEVSRKGMILTDVEHSGDEPMLMALSLPNASVIVSEDRHKAIDYAIQSGVKCIILDDGFNRVEIEKFEILLEPESIKNYLPFPVGAFREFWFSKKYADIIVKEGKDFRRSVQIENPGAKMLLVTAIANPQRLDRYLPQNTVQKVYLRDHDYFDENEIKRLMRECGADSVLCTSKDRVKMEEFGFPISEMKLSLNVDDGIMKKIKAYIQHYSKDSSE